MVKNTPANAGDKRDMGLIPGSGRSPGGEHSTPVFLPGESHGQRSLAGSIGLQRVGHDGSNLAHMYADYYIQNTLYFALSTK